jgi:hypothetical protein
MFRLSKYTVSNNPLDEKTVTCSASTKDWVSSMQGMRLLYVSEDSLRAIASPLPRRVEVDSSPVGC